MRAEKHWLAGMHATAEDASAALELGAACAHVVAPAPVVPWLPEGFEVQVVALTLDPALDVYPLDFVERWWPQHGESSTPPDMVGLRRDALFAISRVAGISWDYSNRTDEQGHPHYVAWNAGLSFARFDGSSATSMGSADIDAREPNGAAYLALNESCFLGRRDLGPELVRLRRFMLRGCETMAMAKAVERIGVRQRYTREELQKPFLVARLVFTGRSTDPETARRLSVLIAERHLQARGAIYRGSGESAA